MMVVAPYATGPHRIVWTWNGSVSARSSVALRVRIARRADSDRILRAEMS
jgi:hypothetical protein